MSRVTEDRLLPRHADSLLTEALEDTRVVALNGARQTGKSTLARAVAATAASPLIRLLDDPATLRAAQDDPAGFVEHEGLLVIDEVQLAPELFRAMKVVVDADPRPGRYLLTGSARILALRDLPDALPGRMETIELWPFSQGEIDGRPDRFVDAAFRHGPALSRSSELRRRDYLDRVVRGGYPEAVRRSPRRRAAFFDAYLTTLIERDVAELTMIQRRGQLRKLLALLAGRSGGLLVANSLAAQAGMSRSTVNRYLSLLDAVFLIKEIPAWSGGQTQRATGTPKVTFVDSGVACHLLGQDAARLGDVGGAAGPMLESFVLMELARQITWNDERVRLHHYRTRDGVEVDGVLEAADGRIVAVEVKAGATVRAENLAGLRHLAQRVGSRFVAGYVLYTGQQTLPFGDRLRALPVDALWHAAP
jgi:predicted AAA+ superfamily ATPase